MLKMQDKAYAKRDALNGMGDSIARGIWQEELLLVSVTNICRF
jgi:hypothetical protein